MTRADPVSREPVECDHGEVQVHGRGRIYCAKCNRWGGIEEARQQALSDPQAQCDGYVGDPGASAPRCESYRGHSGRHFIDQQHPQASRDDGLVALREALDKTLWLARRMDATADSHRLRLVEVSQEAWRDLVIRPIEAILSDSTQASKEARQRIVAEAVAPWREAAAAFFVAHGRAPRNKSDEEMDQAAERLLDLLKESKPATLTSREPA